MGKGTGRGGGRRNHPAVYQPRHGQERSGKLLSETAQDTGLCRGEQRRADVSAMARAGNQLWVESVKFFMLKERQEHKGEISSSGKKQRGYGHRRILF